MCKNPEMLTYDWTKNGGQVTCASCLMRGPFGQDVDWNLQF